MDVCASAKGKGGKSMKQFFSVKVLAFFLVIGLFWFSNAAEADAAVQEDTDFYAVDKNRTTDTDVYIRVSLSTAKNSDYANYTKIRNALEAADSNEKYTLHIELVSDKGAKSCVFPVGYSSSDSPFGTLNIRSMTEIDLGGNTLQATKNMIGKTTGTNIFANCDKNGNRKNGNGVSNVKGGYDLSHDITLKNGTIDGNKNTKTGANLITFGHARGIRVADVTFLHNGTNHLLEFNGCKDITVSNCTFDGYLFQETKDEYDKYISKEALEIDISGKGEDWAAAFDGDNTVCENVIVTGCTFKDYPCGVGDHHSIAGTHTKNVEISNNKFLYSNSTVAGCAIRTFAFDNCKITNNTINGNYATSIRVYGGKGVTVADNTISKAREDGIMIASSSYKKNKVKKDEPVSNAVISNNTIKANGRGIFILEKSSVTDVLNNKITSKRDGVALAQKSVLKNLTGNDIKSDYRGITITVSGKASNLRSNKVTAKNDSALYVATGGTVTTVGGKKGGNTFKSGKKETIIISGKKTTVKELSYNKISSPAISKCSSLKIAPNAKVTSILSNTIDTSGAAGGTGINIFGGSVKKIAGNKITAGLRGIIITNKGKVDAVHKNTVVAAKEYALIVSSKGYAGTVGGTPSNKNTFTSKKKAGVNVNAPGSKIKILSYNTINAKNKQAGYGVWVYNNGKINKIASNKIFAGKKKIQK